MKSASEGATRISPPAAVPHVGSSPARRAGTGPAAGQFRPDIEGMRAIAVGLVIAYHAFGQPFTAGFVGVDVFFVISGFLITSLLLKEGHRFGRIDLLGFYARRVRRILPASTLVVVITLFATYHWLGFIAGNTVARDAQWTAVFSANLHFGWVRTDYFGAQSAPSPLQHMWSLGVEEQFYLIWPAIFLAVVLMTWRGRARTTLAVVLVLGIVTSFTWSVVQTSVNQTWAYFSPLTRAWELAVGALVAVLVPVLARLGSAWVLQVLATTGLAGIVLAAVLLTSDTRYPGAAAALPVIGSAVLIAAGCGARRTLVGRALSTRPMQWIGARSFSMYLWHWPLLVIPAQCIGRHLSVVEGAALVAGAIAASAGTYRFVENPCRRARLLVSHTGLTIGLGVLLMMLTVFLAQSQIAMHYGTWNPLG
ncbi:acyltransferase family protein [Mycolicibacterium sp. S3B2]|uniref:acyltransferase family protein n=1 Tax=Mycolicibacterium sp. S3B2 TaxID=3415120 RepID=UPI003C7C31C7